MVKESTTLTSATPARARKRPPTANSGLHNTPNPSLQPWLTLFAPVASSKTSLDCVLAQEHIDAAVHGINSALLVVFRAADDSYILGVFRSDEVKVTLHVASSEVGRHCIGPEVLRALRDLMLLKEDIENDLTLKVEVEILGNVDADDYLRVAIAAAELLSGRTFEVRDLDVWRQCVHMSLAHGDVSPCNVSNIDNLAIQHRPKRALKSPTTLSPQDTFCRASIFSAIDEWMQYLSRLILIKNEFDSIREILDGLIIDCADAGSSPTSRPGEGKDGDQAQASGLRWARWVLEAYREMLSQGQMSAGMPAYERTMGRINEAESRVQALDPRVVERHRKRRESMRTALANAICLYDDTIKDVSSKIAAFAQAWEDLAKDIATHVSA